MASTTQYSKKSKKVDNDHTKDIDTNLIYSRVLLLTQHDSITSNNSELTVQNILNYELFSAPLPLFYANGEMRISKNKACLKNKLKIEINSRSVIPTI